MALKSLRAIVLTHLLWLCILLAAGGGEMPDYPALWKEHFQSKPIDMVLDDTALVEMDLFKAVPGIRPMIAAMASALQATGLVYALSGYPYPDMFENRAQELKGAPLTPYEKRKMEKLYAEIMGEVHKRHPELKSSAMVLDITFGLRDVRYLEKNAAECKMPPAVVQRIAKWHGCKLEMEYVAEVSRPVLWKSLTMGIPVVLQEGDKWYVAFGLSGNLVAYDLPEQIPLLRTMERISHRDMLKSIRSSDTKPQIRQWLINSIKRDRFGKMTITTDFQVKPSAVMPKDGSIVIEEFQEGRFAGWFFHSGRESVEGLDGEIIRLLNLPAPQPKVLQPTGKRDEDMWNRYFRGKYDRVMGNSRLVEALCVAADNEINPLCASLICNMEATKGLAACRSAMCPEFFQWHACRTILGDELADLSEEAKKALAEVAARAMAEGGIKAPPPQKYMPEAALPAAQRLMKIAGEEKELEGVLRRIARLHGWDVVMETGDNIPYAKYQEALNRRIPLVLREKGSGRWLIGLGYAKDSGKDYLLLCDPRELKEKEFRLSRHNAWPEAGFWFEEFGDGKYDIWILHHWSDTLKAWDEEVKEAMKKAGGK